MIDAREARVSAYEDAANKIDELRRIAFVAKDAPDVDEALDIAAKMIRGLASNARAVPTDAHDPGDVIYIRHGAHGLQLAVIIAMGEGDDAGMMLVRRWRETKGLGAQRWIPTHEERGTPGQYEERLALVRAAYREKEGATS